MYVKNSNFVVFLTLAAVVGFGLSFLLGGTSVQSGLLGGDISKANRYSNQKEDPSFTVVEERLRNDGEFLDRTKGAIGFLQNRMIVLSELTERTIEACAGIPEFQPLMAELQSMNARAFNTAAALSDANDGLDKVVAGKNAPEYELYSNQAYIGVSKVESQMGLGKRFCRIATSFLEGKDEGQYQKIAELLAVWEVYCLQDSQMFADGDHSKSKPDSTDSSKSVIISGILTGFGNSAFDEYLNGIATGEVLNTNIDWAGLGGSTLVDAFPSIGAMAARPIPGVAEIKNSSEQTLSNAHVEYE